MKKLIITIDTEGDNLWHWHAGEEITTQNARYLPRFQSLCEKYGFKPVWLTNYEMVMDNYYVDFAKDVISRNAGEIGMHLHAWNTPPQYDLTGDGDSPYLIEYPYEIMERKIAVTTSAIESRIGIKPISHRAGRWAVNDSYIKILEKYGYKVDCSVTPHVDWSKTLGKTEKFGGIDYSNFSENPFLWNNILEVPMSIRTTRKFFRPDKLDFRSVLVSVAYVVKGQKIWLRPSSNNIMKMLWLIKNEEHLNSDYLMFMLHSSEMMPGGSPNFITEEAIDKMYSDIEAIFDILKDTYCGCTLSEYYEKMRENSK